MNQIKIAAAAVIAAWGILVDCRLPQWLTAPFKSMRIPSELVLAAFPVTGVIIALVPLFIAGVVSLLFNNVAGALIFALAGGAVLLFKDSGRGAVLLLSYIGQRVSGSSAAEALENCDSSPANLLRNPVYMFYAVISAMIVFCMLFVLFFYGAGIWFAGAMAADALVQGRLCLKRNRATGVPFILVPEKRGNFFLAAVSVVIGVILLAIFPRIAALGGVPA